MQNVLAATAGYDDRTQRALARRDALVAAAHATIAWARAQRSAHRVSVAIPIVLPPREPAAASFSISPLIDAARSAGDAGITAARGARSATRVALSALTTVGTGVRRSALPVLRVLPRVAALVAVGAGVWFGALKARPYVERWKDTPPITRMVPAVTQAEVAPVDLAISEGTRSLRLDDRLQVMLSPGTHELLFENRALGYQEVRQVNVRPGETTQLSIAPPRSKASFTSTAPADVWLDGVAVGQTPLVDLPVEIGTHHVRMKSGAAERQFTVTATMTPLAFNADFSQ